MALEERAHTGLALDPLARQQDVAHQMRALLGRRCLDDLGDDGDELIARGREDSPRSDDRERWKVRELRGVAFAFPVLRVDELGSHRARDHRPVECRSGCRCRFGSRFGRYGGEEIAVIRWGSRIDLARADLESPFGNADLARATDVAGGDPAVERNPLAVDERAVRAARVADADPAITDVEARMQARDAHIVEHAVGDLDVSTDEHGAAMEHAREARRLLLRVSSLHGESEPHARTLDQCLFERKDEMAP